MMWELVSFIHPRFNCGDQSEVTMDNAAFRASRGWSCTSSFIQRTIFGLILGALFVLASCGKKEAPGQHATILMRDGTTMTGTVTATSPDQITVAGDDNVTHNV
jgi:hypothetical protein